MANNVARVIKTIIEELSCELRSITFYIRGRAHHNQQKNKKLIDVPSNHHETIGHHNLHAHEFQKQAYWAVSDEHLSNSPHVTNGQ